MVTPKVTPMEALADLRDKIRCTDLSGREARIVALMLIDIIEEMDQKITAIMNKD